MSAPQRAWNISEYFPGIEVERSVKTALPEEVTIEVFPSSFCGGDTGKPKLLNLLAVVYDGGLLAAHSPGSSYLHVISKKGSLEHASYERYRPSTRTSSTAPGQDLST